MFTWQRISWVLEIKNFFAYNRQEGVMFRFKATLIAIIVVIFSFSCSKHQIQEKETTDGDLSFFDQDASENREHPDVDDNITDDGMFHCDENGLCTAPSGWLFARPTGEVSPTIWIIPEMVVPIVQIATNERFYKYVETLPLSYVPTCKEEFLYPLFLEERKVIPQSADDQTLQIMGLKITQESATGYGITPLLRRNTFLSTSNGSFAIIPEREGYGVALDLTGNLPWIDIELGQFLLNAKNYVLPDGKIILIASPVKRYLACQMIGLAGEVFTGQYMSLLQELVAQGRNDLVGGFALVSFLDSASLLATILSAVPGGNTLQECVSACLAENLSTGINCLSENMVMGSGFLEQTMVSSRHCLIQLLVDGVCANACTENVVEKGILKDALDLIEGIGFTISLIDVADMVVDACWQTIHPIYGEFITPLTDEYSDDSEPDENTIDNDESNLVIDGDATIPDTEDTTPTCEEQCSSANAECGRIGSCNCGSCTTGFECTEHQCVTQTPSCTNLCGDRECGNYSSCNCGDCDSGYTCSNNYCKKKEVCDPGVVWQKSLGHNLLVCPEGEGYIPDIGKSMFGEELYYFHDSCTGTPTINQARVVIHNKRLNKSTSLGMERSGNKYWLPAGKYLLHQAGLVQGDTYSVFVDVSWDGGTSQRLLTPISFTAHSGSCK